ncbi:hypothetical protein ACTD5D_31010 [Nocardia takedensis]|uniref:hypothetical protein n=1 Tax=Nocardia takedensis TaxID=259390 RepID=UPI003F75EF54
MTYDRGRGVGHSTLASMAGPEFAGVGAVYAPLNALPVTPRLVVLAVLVLVGMGGCSAAWIDQQHYVPSPDICRAADAGVPAETPGSCVPADQVSGVAR